MSAALRKTACATTTSSTPRPGSLPRDALSTACFVLGEAGSLALRDTLAAEKNLRIELILVTDDGHVRYTAGLAERFEPSEEGTYVYEAIIA